MSFWNDLLDTKHPIVGLSPMDGVTDAAMRYMTARYGGQNHQTSGVDVLFCEFVSVDALRHAKDEYSVDRLMQAFIKAREVGPLEHKPFEVAQVFGHIPELFYAAAVMIAELGFDGMDINMGCPAHKVEEHGSGAGLIRSPQIAKEIIRQAKDGITDWAEGKTSIDDLQVSQAIKDWVKARMPSKPRREQIPVSVKTRIGVDTEVVEEWMQILMSEDPAMISLHGRTLKQLYQGRADWEAIARAAKVVHALGGHILGNGDIASIEDLRSKVKGYGVDGGLIGRAAEGNPAIFRGKNEVAKKEKLAWILEHVKVFEMINKPKDQDIKGGDSRWFSPVRKHLAWYAHGFPGAVELRIKLVTSNSREEVEKIVGQARLEN